MLPAHEGRPIDLFSAETAFLLAQTVALLGDQLDAEVAHRIYAEVDRRVLEPYLRWHYSLGWYKGGNNWNGVCNSSVASAFLLLERDPRRVAEALAIAFSGLQTFLDTAFESDGSSNEGVGYWNYGLINLIALSEMLRARSGGALDPLVSPRLRQIAGYPAAVQLSGPVFAAFSDCDEKEEFNFGIIQRLAERSGVAALRNLTAKPAEPGSDWRIQMLIRNLLWWDGAPARRARHRRRGADRARHRPPDRNDRNRRAVRGRDQGRPQRREPQPERHRQLRAARGRARTCSPILAGAFTAATISARIVMTISSPTPTATASRASAGSLQAPGRQFCGELTAVTTEPGIQVRSGRVRESLPSRDLTGASRTLAIEEQRAVILTDAFEFTGRRTADRGSVRHVGRGRGARADRRDPLREAHVASWRSRSRSARASRSNRWRKPVARTIGRVSSSV